MRTVMEEALPPGGTYVFEDDTETVLALGPGFGQEGLLALVEGIERRAAEQVFLVPALATRTVPEPLGGLCDAYDELCGELADGGNCEAFVVLARNYIDKHYWNPELCLEDAAAELQISPGYLSRLMKRETGFPFVEYLNRIRVKKATLLMSDPSAKAFEVAERVGYRSQHYFSRAFKKVTGNSPTDYRKGA
jgi:two-component system response regulator YesN